MKTTCYLTRKVNEAWSIAPTGAKKKDINGNFKYQYVLIFRDKGDGSESVIYYWSYAPNSDVDYRENAVQRFCSHYSIYGYGYAEYQVMLYSKEVYTKMVNNHYCIEFDTLEHREAFTHILYDLTRGCFTC